MDLIQQKKGLILRHVEYTVRSEKLQSEVKPSCPSFKFMESSSYLVVLSLVNNYILVLNRKLLLPPILVLTGADGAGRDAGAEFVDQQADGEVRAAVRGEGDVLGPHCAGRPPALRGRAAQVQLGAGQLVHKGELAGHHHLARGDVGRDLVPRLQNSEAKNIFMKFSVPLETAMPKW